MCFQFQHGLADMSILYRTRSEGYITFTIICQKLRVAKLIYPPFLHYVYKKHFFFTYQYVSIHIVQLVKGIWIFG